MIKLKVDDLFYNARVESTGSRIVMNEIKEVECSIRDDQTNKFNSIDDLLQKREFLLTGEGTVCYIKYGVITDCDWERRIDYEYGNLFLTINCKYEPKIASNEKELLKELI